MKILQMFRSEPDEVVRELADLAFQGHENSEVMLFEGELDYRELVEAIFDNERIICWW